MIARTPEDAVPAPGPSAVLRDVVRVACFTQYASRVGLFGDHRGFGWRCLPETDLPAGTVAVLVFVSPRDARALGAELPEEDA